MFIKKYTNRRIIITATKPEYEQWVTMLSSWALHPEYEIAALEFVPNPRYDLYKTSICTNLKIRGPTPLMIE